MSTAIALRHVAFEDAGLVETAARARGMTFDYVEAPSGDMAALDALAPDLLVVLGGPIGVYQTDAYPFLAPEIAAVRARLDADRPTLGVCLGAQIMAAALGAEVRPSETKEVGYGAIVPNPAGEAGVLAPLADCGWRVLHWHGDVIAPFDGVDVLASTDPTPVQAFARGLRALGLQFHVEVEPGALESWLVGHACEIAMTPGLEPRILRAQRDAAGAAVAAAGRKIIDAWLERALD